MRSFVLFCVCAAGLFALVWASVGQASVPAPERVCGAQICDRGAALRAVYEGAPAHWPKAHLDADIAYVELGALERPEFQRDDPVAQLGARLFDDPVLSRSGQFSCASCHSPGMWFTDGQRSSFGHDRQQGARNAPTLLDKAQQPSFMWDGSATSLAHQAMMPITNPIEMAADRALVEARLNADASYQEAFATVFGEEQITLELVSEAIAIFEMTLYRTTRFDRFMRGEHQRLSDQQILGLHLFRTTGRCANCHMGPRLTDDDFHNLGLHFYGRSREDLGRYAITGDPADVGAFRTPSLRHVGETAPYMHNGLIPHLHGVINIYNEGGARPRPRDDLVDDPLFPETSDRLHELELTDEERSALEAFLRAL